MWPEIEDTLVSRNLRRSVLDLLDQLHLRAVGRGNPAHMPTVVDALFENLRAVLLKVREGAGVIVGLDRDVLDADMLLMVLVGDDGRHVEGLPNSGLVFRASAAQRK